MYVPPFLLIAILFSACTATEPFNNSEGEAAPAPWVKTGSSLPIGSFGNTDSGFQGDLTIRGFASTERIQEPFCQTDCEAYTYVFFHILETANAEALRAFLQGNRGNAYVRDNALGLGCAEEGLIRTVNRTATTGMQEKVIPAEVSQKILDSTVKKPINLFLSKEPAGGGTEAPACYSHFTKIDLAM